jgi:hypothetical protein
MKKKFKLTILTIEVFLPDLIGVLFNMSPNFLLNGFVISLITVFTIEYFGINQKIIDWISCKWKPKSDISVQQTINNDILTINQTLDYLREYNVKNCNGYVDILFALSCEKKEPINQTLYNLLKYAKQGNITIYCQRTETINNIIKLPFENADLVGFCYKESWSEDLTLLYSNGNMVFTNLHVKKSELDSLIEKFAIQRPSNLI